MVIARVRIICLDTSILGDLARDYFSLNTKLRSNVLSLLQQFEDNDIRILLSAHHLAELLSHGNFDVAERRIKFLEALPNVAWIASHDQKPPIGSIVDVLAHEADVAADRPNYSAVDVRDAARNRVFGFGTGAQATVGYSSFVTELRPHLARHENSAREIVAIGRARHIDYSKIRARSFLFGRQRSSEGSSKALLDLRDGLRREVATRGDERIASPHVVADKFMIEVSQDVDKMRAKGPDGPREYLRERDIDPDEIGDLTTIADVSDWVIFRGQLRTANIYLKRPWEHLKRTVAGHRVPSWIVQDSIRKFGQDLKQRKGSDLTDGHLAAFAPYADFNVVDKRTYESIRRARSKSPSLDSLLLHVGKVGHYGELPKQLGIAC